MCYLQLSFVYIVAGAAVEAASFRYKHTKIPKRIVNQSNSIDFSPGVRTVYIFSVPTALHARHPQKTNFSFKNSYFNK